MTAGPDLQAMSGYRPRTRSGLLISGELRRGRDRIHLLKIRGGKVFEVSPKERFLIGRLDGVRTIGEISDLYAGEFGRRLGPANWSQLLYQMHQRELLDNGRGPGGTDVAGDSDTADAAPDAADPVGMSPGPLLTGLARVCRPVLTRSAAIGWIGGLLAMYLAIGLQWLPLWRSAEFGDWRVVVGVIAVGYLSAMLHELAHGVVATRFGCSSVQINLLALNCRAEDYQFLASRSRQVAIAAAGGIVNSVVVLPFFVAWALIPPDAGGRGFLAAVVVVCSIQALINYLPLAPLDGYKMLSHLLGSVSLARESRRYLWSRPRRWFGRGGQDYPTGARFPLSLYAAIWHIAIAAGAFGAVVAGGGLLQQHLGRAGYALAAAVVVLVLSLWLVIQTRHRTPIRSRPR